MISVMKAQIILKINKKSKTCNDQPENMIFFKNNMVKIVVLLLIHVREGVYV